MKNTFKLFGALLIVSTMISCDPSCTQECVVKNQSGHDVVVTRYYTKHCGPYNNWEPIEDSVRVYIDTLNIGTETKYVDGHLGVANRESNVFTMRYMYWGDSVVFTFDDGSCHTFLPETDTSWGPYAFNSDSYIYEERPHEGRTFKGQVLWSRLSYTLTSEDYERCLRCLPLSRQDCPTP